MTRELAKIRDEYKSIEKILKNLWQQAGPGADLGSILQIGNDDVSQLSHGQKQARIGTLTERFAFLGQEAERISYAARGGRPRLQMVHPGGTTRAGDFDQTGESLGNLVVKSQEFNTWVQNGKAGEYGGRFPVLSSQFFNTLFETGAGWAPQSIREKEIVPAVTRPIQVLDIMPVRETGRQGSVLYMLETTRTHSAAEKAEGAAFAESIFVLTEKEISIRKVTDSLPVTDEQLDDVRMARSYINDRLIFGVRQRLDNQILNGDGVAPNLLGILNTAGIQTQAKGADPTPDAIHKAITKVKVTGRSMPTHLVIHPNDWEEIRLLRTADGEYIFGHPSNVGVPTLFGLTVIESDAIVEGTGLVGAFSTPWIWLAERSDVDVQIGYTGTQFTEGERTIRASGRWAVVLARPASMCTVTGI